MSSWTMPEWMEPYREHIGTCCGVKTVEECMDDETPYQTNAPRALMMCELGGRVAMLEILHGAGMLKDAQ